MFRSCSSRLRWPLLSSAAAALVVTTTTALAGSGVGGVFNLGQVNTVDAQTILTGNPGGNPELKVTSTGTAAAVRGTAVNGIGTNGISTSGVGQQGLSTSGIGTLGTHAATTGIPPGVQGETNSTDPAGAGVVGRNNGGGPGLKAIVNAGAPPLAVNSLVKVTNLNADLLDGLDSSALQKRVTGTCGAGSAVKMVNSDGTVVCEPVGGGGVWSLNGNSGTTPGTNFLGTSDNKALELKVNGQRALRIEPDASSPNLIGGSPANSVASGVVGATIGGGGSAGVENSVTGGFGTVGGGWQNTAGGSAVVAGGQFNGAGGNYSAVGGGYGNVADGAHATVGGGDTDTASGDNSAVGGGSNNLATGLSSTVGGGANNQGTNTYATVAGGSGNLASGYATVAGGSGNLASGGDSAIGGGLSNTASGAESTVGGGAGNTSGDESAVGGGVNNGATNAYSTVGGGWFDTASGYESTVGGGFSNTASGDQSVVGGGQQNTASGAGSIVPGGYKVTASGAGSFAAGSFAHADHEGAFVWGDAQGTTMASSADDQFIARAAGHFFLQSDSTLDNQGGFINTSTGAYLSTGGTWTNNSNRALKHDFRPLDKKSVLQKIGAMPLSSWSYKAEKPSVRHIGPTAQDFHAAFGLGSDNKHISTIDEGGVALAAIQGLYRQNQALQRDNRTMQRENRSLRAQLGAQNTRLTKLEQAFSKLSR